MILKTKNIVETTYKAEDDVMVKPTEEDEALRAKVYQLNGMSQYLGFYSLIV